MCPLIVCIFLIVNKSNEMTKTYNSNKSITECSYVPETSMNAPLYWVTCSSIVLNMGTAVYLESIPHKPFCCCKYSCSVPDLRLKTDPDHNTIYFCLGQLLNNTEPSCLKKVSSWLVFKDLCLQYGLRAWFLVFSWDLFSIKIKEKCQPYSLRLNLL